MRHNSARLITTLSIMVILFSVKSFSQSNNNYYYYKGQQVSITLSEQMMFIKFVTGLTNSQKASLIQQAQVDLQNADPNDIPDIVQLKSRILQRQVWIYPCGIPPGYRNSKDFDSTKHYGPKEMQKCDPPCGGGGGGGDCTPYQVWQNYDNFYEALLFFLDNVNVISGSKAIIGDNSEFTAICEDFL